MSYYLIVVADTNDADYITRITRIDPNELVRVAPIAKAIKNCGYDYNWPTNEFGTMALELVYDGVLTKDDIKWFNTLVPYAEYGVHTIIGIEYLIASEKVKLL